MSTAVLKLGVLYAKIVEKKKNGENINEVRKDRA